MILNPDQELLPAPTTCHPQKTGIEQLLLRPESYFSWASSLTAPRKIGPQHQYQSLSIPSERNAASSSAPATALPANYCDDPPTASPVWQTTKSLSNPLRPGSGHGLVFLSPACPPNGTTSHLTLSWWHRPRYLVSRHHLVESPPRSGKFIRKLFETRPQLDTVTAPDSTAIPILLSRRPKSHAAP